MPPKKASRSLAAGVKESCRWVEGYQQLAEQTPLLPATRLVYVADREGDFIELLAKASTLGTPVDWLIRSCQNRLVAGEQDKLWEGPAASHLLGGIRFTLRARKGQKAREVLQQVLDKRGALTTRGGEAVHASVVVAQAIDAPNKIKPIVWRPLTNRCAASLEAAAELIDWYRCRWEIELFFDVLKDGCKVGQLKLSTIDRRELALVLFMIVVWRIQRLMRLGRTCPEINCETVFDREE